MQVHGYHIVKDAPKVPSNSVRKTAERRAMEALEVGEGFNIAQEYAAQRAMWARRPLFPKRFSIRKTVDGWFVRREE
jgi:hypothetical protein